MEDVLQLLAHFGGEACLAFRRLYAQCGNIYKEKNMHMHGLLRVVIPIKMWGLLRLKDSANKLGFETSDCVFFL
jgi:hypothetical protein